MCKPRLCGSLWGRSLFFFAVVFFILGGGRYLCTGLSFLGVCVCALRLVNIHSDCLRWLQEFEVIAQIKLLQSACNNYSFTQEDHFVDWFHSLERLSEAER